jgi:hypothetical protein
MISFGNNKMSYKIDDKEVWYIQYDVYEGSNSVEIKFMKSYGISDNWEQWKIKWLWEYMLRDFIEKTNFENYKISTVLMDSKWFYFKTFKRLLKDWIITDLKFLRNNHRKWYKSLCDEIKKLTTITHAYNGIEFRKNTLWNTSLNIKQQKK